MQKLRQELDFRSRMFGKNVKQKVAGFSLVELLVTMAIIAVLLGLVGFGIATAQRNSRDSQRRQAVSDIRLALEDYLTRKNTYPQGGAFTFNGTDQIILNTGDSNAITLEVNGAQTPGAETASDATRYCYEPTANGGYILGAKLENGEWFDQSSTIDGTSVCSDTSANPFS